MSKDKINLKAESGKTIEVTVTDMKPDAIWVAIGEGIDNIKCKLIPTSHGRAYVGNVMGREVVYERSVEDVKKELGGKKVERKPVK